MTSLRDLRDAFVSFFSGRDHLVAPSSTLVPDDPTLMFTNAGMVQFKNAFTGIETPPAPRAVSVQKCVRAGGKHNDLDNVGYTARHHTFFEMLGNFSFGDYFKEQAIVYAWDFSIKELGLPVEKVWATIHPSDDEARGLWRRISGLPDDRIVGIADNLWSMGPVGPCGFCSELFFDQGDRLAGGPPGSPDEDGDRYLEFWNLVFMQFDQAEDGTRTPLPKPSIDTGMGLERIAAILQGVPSNYEIDLFERLIGASVEATGRPASGDDAPSHRVIADHLRASAFLIADGVTPSNEGRGYVLRRIMRRAMRHAHLLGAETPLLHRLAPVLEAEMGAAYPELVRAGPTIVATLEQEEERFRRTLGRGLHLLDEATRGFGPGGVLDGETAFRLYDTYGFPIDLTQDALRARGLGVDLDGFGAAMERERDKSRDSWQGSGSAGADADWIALRERLGATRFTGYEALEGEGVVVAIVGADGAARDRILPGDGEVQVVLDTTPFYAESGGQVGDRGLWSWPGGGAANVRDVKKRAGDLHAHAVTVTAGALAVGDRVSTCVDGAVRNQTRANHSATHLLHAALRSVLGAHVSQKGSYVGPDRLRFDFSHGGPVTRAELATIEDQVNALVRQNAEVGTREMPPQAAIEAGAMALFGEKYGDVVRVLSMGAALGAAERPYSVELCGGTHAARTGDIALVKVVAETGVAAGIRRIEALTGAAAKAYLDEQVELARRLAETLKAPLADAPARLEAVLDERKRLEQELAAARRKLALGGGEGAAPAGPEAIAGVSAILRVADGVGAKDLRTLVDQAKSQIGSGVAAFIGVLDGKAAITVGVTDDLSARIDARRLAQAASAAVGGTGGGGRPDMAQAGGPDGAKAADGLAAIRAEIARMVSADVGVG